MLDPRSVAVAGVILAEAAPIGMPSEVTALGRDLIVAGVLFYFYRQIATDFKRIVQDNAVALQKLADKLDSMPRCSYQQGQDGPRRTV